MNHISPVWSRSATVIADHGEGIYLYDKNGRRYLDFTSGIGVTNTGHAHPKVVQAIQSQAGKILHAQANIVYHEPMIHLTEELSQIVPPKLDTFFFSNSGAEAVEAAVKLARAATGKPNIIVFQGSFHGRTHATMAMTTSKTIYRAGYQPLVPGIFVAPFPYAYAYGWDEETTVNFCIKELKKLLKMQTAAHETAAIVIEPELGEGGYVPAPNRFMQKLRQLCDENGILLVADEVQTGFGRTGKWFASEHSGVTPDILIMAKGLASGMPLSGIAAPRELMDKWPPGSHGGTYGGNAVACAAAVATIQVLREENLIENAADMGIVLTTGLRKLQEEHPEIGDVRGWGLMVASEFTTPAGEPWGERATAVAKACHEQNLMLLTCGAYGNVIRWIPPLVVNQSQIQDALQIFSKAITASK
ncbi:MAG: aminotransferase class III-fold pyridoxal phosphate-dependent enzyme [Chloroflexi bacterium]|nr:aminotransferase class III-fold pyridoxal phosphate-dependent enzyme [Ardenticatenaceae bacterium]MBL1129269.1 aminotransferase class III-fold pyridoxal phosphate-dependent enzyme [Chloroflexota bacterium]NOG35345.1 aminotransferase class III-fold pyridoxal phosphate-dependent enzyme [Chloroflexota bacterium]